MPTRLNELGEEHANGITDDEKAILASKQAITAGSLGRHNNENTNGLDSGSRLNGLSYKDIFPVATGPNRKQDTKDFLQNVLELLWNFISDSNDRETKVLEFHHPEQLMKIMDFSLP